jgi:hypothetical protein
MNYWVKQIKIFGIVRIQRVVSFLDSRSENKPFYRWLYDGVKGLLRCIPLTPYKLTDHATFSLEHYSPQVVLETNRVGHTSKLVFGMVDEPFALLPASIPDIRLSKLEGVRIQGNSDFVIVPSENVVINDFGFNMDPKYANVDGALLTQKDNLALMRYDGHRVDRTLGSGIMLSGKFGLNYYHELYEILIKLLLLDKVEIPAEVPLIIDEVVLRVPSFKQVFDCLNQSGRDVFTIGPKEIVAFDTLYCLSAVNMIPPFKVDFKDDGLNDLFFDLKYTLLMRQRLLTFRSQREFPKRIFLSRKSSKNRQYNEDEVIALVAGYGFTVVCPEQYDLFDQMALFQGAECIIGASGAAFSNLLFCSSACRIICFVSRELNIPAFSTLAYALNCPMRYCLGTPDSKDLHAGYTVDLVMLEQLLNEFIVA